MSRNTHPRLSLSRSILTGAILVFSAPLYAQAASYTYIDQKAPYKNANPPMLTALNLPKVGTTFKVRIPNVYYVSDNYWTWGWSKSVSYALAVGVKNPNMPIPWARGFLFTSADILLVRWNPQQNGGTVTVPFPIPNSPQLVGIGFYQQILEATQDITWWGYQQWETWSFRLSRGGHGMIGK